MNEPGPDEKICPFCAETIKAAAVKCRFCRSDVPATGPWEPVVGPPVLDVVTTGAVEAPAGVPAGNETKAGPVLVLLVVLCLLLATATVWLALDDPERSGLAAVASVAASPERVVVPGGSGAEVAAEDPMVAEARQAATAHAAAVLSYGYRTLAQDQAAARAVMADGFRAEYDRVMKKTAPMVRQNKFTLRATAVDASLVSIDPERAVALLFVNSVITSKDSPERQTDRSRVLMTMTRQDGTWIVSQIDALLIN